jgi:hypothetical protein
MATHFARGILNTREPLSTRLSAACHQSASRLPEYRQSRYRASRSLLAELLFMLYGISELPEIITKRMETRFSRRTSPAFFHLLCRNIVGVALPPKAIAAWIWNYRTPPAVYILARRRPLRL